MMDHEERVVSLFEEEIISLENKIKARSNNADLVVFYGSSSIRLWDTLEEDLAPLNVMNLGFGGSSFAWCMYYYERLFSGLNPSKVVLYVGDNDIGNGLPPQKVARKFRQLATMFRKSFPGIPLAFITIKPSPEREHLLEKTRLTNQLIRKELLALTRADMIDVFESMLDEHGKARPELYMEDQLHLNCEGYRVWKGVVRKYFGI